MAQEKSKARRTRKPETVRERVEKTKADPKQRRLLKTARKISTPLKTAHQIGGKEYYLPMPDNKVGRFLNKRRYVIPRFFINAWRELRGVTWPNRKQTRQLTLAVFMFSIVFGAIIAITDYGLDKLFRKVLLK